MQKEIKVVKKKTKKKNSAVAIPTFEQHLDLSKQAKRISFLFFLTDNSSWEPLL